MYKLNRLMVEVISALLILLFVYTGTSKLLENKSFELVISRSPILSERARYLSWILPVTELASAALLLIPSTRLYGLASSFLLMLLFTLYIGYMILFIPHLPCSCGGILKHLTWTQHLVFNVVFTTLSAYGIWLNRQNHRFIAINTCSVEASRNRQDSPKSCRKK